MEINQCQLKDTQGSRLDPVTLIGSGAYVWNNGVYTNVPALARGYIEVWSINDLGEVVGQATNGEGTTAGLMWSSARGSMGVDGLSGGQTKFYDVNNHSIAVGSSQAEIGGTRAIIWSAGNGIRDLNLLGDFPAWNLRYASAINDKGQIVGSGTLNGFETAFLLTPLVDQDGDGTPDNQDNCPSISNEDRLNTDEDSAGDVCDSCPADPLNDSDGDGVCGDVDNCPEISNSNQDDLDGDACDIDADGDSFIAQGQDCNNFDATIFPRACDVKRDGIDQNCDGVDRIGGKPCTPDDSIGKEQYCADGIDNDGDGALDCRDTDCFKKNVCR